MLKLKLNCPRHPRYNPEKDGEGKIKGGCELCLQLFKFSEAAEAFRVMARPGPAPRAYVDVYGPRLR